MILFLGILIVSLFAALLFLNFYFRIKILKLYKRLVQNKVEFSIGHLFNRQRMEKEIWPQYPQHQQDIESFVQHIHYSLKIALLLIALITVLGFILVNL